MAINAMPAVDQNICGAWSEQDIRLYNSLPFYLAKMQVDRRKTWSIWSPLCGSRKWQANEGAIIKTVRKEPSPNVRQLAFPNAIDTTPKVDIMDVRELTEQAILYHQDFQSQVMHFVPSFRDFLTDHVTAQGDDIMEKMERYEDIFYRGMIFALSPYVWIADRTGGQNELTAAPTGLMNTANTAVNSKNTVWLQSVIAQIGEAGNLSLLTLNKLTTIAETYLRNMPFKGTGKPGDDTGLVDKYLVVCDGEAFNQFMFDPYLQANKNCQLDVVQQSFKGNLFGRLTCRLEDLPMRIAADGTFPAPETREGNPLAYNVGESVITTPYDDAPIGIAWMVGQQGYDVIQVGPPPSIFASKGMPDGFGKMFWNAQIVFSKNFLIPCYDDQNNLFYQPNEYGRYLKLISTSTYGLIAKQRRNIIPIFYRRKRGGSSLGVKVIAA